ncbi:MAG: M14 family metallopeptidase [Burkholderiales bacterium]|nr:M14 family metallopeptidase [Burkholderiales bacterium]MDE2505531.1 M14 family metallopeptidase [Burkholderiales bacterium]
MIDPCAGFATSYAQARQRFVAAAEAAGLEVHGRAHPMLGVDGETLAMDIARSGPADAAALLILSSGCHGVEGYCGSGVQNALLADAGFRAAAARAGVALLFVHALNPYGFSWSRRVTHENVDLNRNWQDFSAPLPRNPAYDEIEHWLLPAQWPPAPEVEAALAAWIARRGIGAFQAALSQGQYAHPEGLFFGGHDPTWSRQTLSHVLQEQAGRCRRLAWIDFHTGLGPCGHGERIHAGPDDAATLARARAWWGAQVTSTHDGSSTSPPLSGMMWNAAPALCPQAEYTGIALEFGTLPLQACWQALREDQWFERHPEADAGGRAAVRARMRAAFYVETDDWKRSVVAQSRAAALQALAGLAAP